MTRTLTLTADQHAALVEVLTASGEDWSHDASQSHSLGDHHRGRLMRAWVAEVTKLLAVIDIAAPPVMS